MKKVCFFLLITFLNCIQFKQVKTGTGTVILLPSCVIKNIFILHAGQERIYINKTFHYQNWRKKTLTPQNNFLCTIPLYIYIFLC